MLKGFGFINFTTKKDALVAISQMDGKMLMNRKISVSLAQQKEEYKKTEDSRKEFEEKKQKERQERDARRAAQRATTNNNKQHPK